MILKKKSVYMRVVKIYIYISTYVKQKRRTKNNITYFYIKRLTEHTKLI